MAVSELTISLTTTHMLYMENREATVKNIRDTGCCMQCTKKASVQVAVVQSSEMHARLPLFPSLHKAPNPSCMMQKMTNSNQTRHHTCVHLVKVDGLDLGKICPRI